MRYTTVVIVLLQVAFATEKLWEPDCGISLYEDAGQGTPSATQPDQQIVGGVDARIYEFPWQVSVVYTNESHYCGGFIVTSGHVITAAHCINKDKDNPTGFQVEVGKWKRINEGDNKHRQRITVSAIIVHPEYNNRTIENDIAILELSEELDFTQSEGAVQPICKPDPDNDYSGRQGTVSGWGTTRSGAPYLPNVLQYANLSVITNEDCKSARCDYMPDVYPGSICAGECGTPNPTDTCNGDSGGPMAVKNSEGRWEVIGITSWGYDCGSPYPGVYVRVSHYNEWIDTIVGV